MSATLILYMSTPSSFQRCDRTFVPLDMISTIILAAISASSSGITAQCSGHGLAPTYITLLRLGYADGCRWSAMKISGGYRSLLITPRHLGSFSKKSLRIRSAHGIRSLMCCSTSRQSMFHCFRFASFRIGRSWVLKNDFGDCTSI